MQNLQFTFAVPAIGNKWCEITCIVVPDVILDQTKYNQQHRIWEVNISLVFTANEGSKHYDHKVYYFCCVGGRWLLGDLVTQQFALLSHPLLDRLKLKILEHYPELVSADNPLNDANANSPVRTNFQHIKKPARIRKDLGAGY